MCPNCDHSRQKMAKEGKRWQIKIELENLIKSRNFL